MQATLVRAFYVTFWLTVILVPRPTTTQDGLQIPTPIFNVHADPERRLNIDYDPFDQEMMADRQEGQDCQDECDRFIGYGSGLCATLSSFTANVGCFIITFANPVHCGVLQGVMFAFGGYCTSSAPARICAVCREGFSMKMILHREILIDQEMVKVRNMQRDLELVREEMSFLSRTWHTKQSTFEMQLRSAGHFDDVDHLLQVMSLIEYSPEGVPLDNHALKLFLDTALSPARHGVLNLINKFHRIFAGGGHCVKCFGGRKSIFEINPDFYCQIEVVTDLDNVNGKKIDNLHDLEKLPNMKILLREDSYIDNAMRQLENWHKFQSRIEYIGDYDVDYADLLTKIRNGTHVMIEDGYNFKEILVQTNLNESCQFHESEFQLSAERLFSLPSTFPMRKGFVHAEEINRRLMWIDAFGLAGQYDKNINLLSQGIFSPVKMDEDCKFDESMMRGPKGLCSGETKTNRVERLGWKHFRILFTYLAGGWVLAGIVFLIEFVKNPQKRQQSTQPQNCVP